MSDSDDTVLNNRLRRYIKDELDARRLSPKEWVQEAFRELSQINDSKHFISQLFSAELCINTLLRDNTFIALVVDGYYVQDRPAKKHTTTESWWICQFSQPNQIWFIYVDTRGTMWCPFNHFSPTMENVVIELSGNVTYWPIRPGLFMHLHPSCLVPS